MMARVILNTGSASVGLVCLGVFFGAYAFIGGILLCVATFMVALDVLDPRP